MQYEVTIGIPVYRAVDYISNTMESALNQTFSSIEYLIVDDCGNDGTMDVIEKLQHEHPRGENIRILRHDKNHGVGMARNLILEEAKGRYLFFMDSDDIVESDAIDILVAVAKKGNAEVVYGSWVRVDHVNQGNSQYSVYPYKELFTTDALALYAFKNYSTFRISVCNALFELSFLRSTNLKFVDMPFWEDLVFTYEMVTKVKRAILLPNITYHYICRVGSLSHYQNREILPKQEIIDNINAIAYLKDMCHHLEYRKYMPFLCYNLGMNSYYVMTYILSNSHKIIPDFTTSDMCGLFYYPKSLFDIFKYRNKFFQNILFWGLGQMPCSLSLLSVRFLKMVKR